MNHILAVCDSEAEYSYGLADYLSTGKGFPFEVQAFTSLANLKEFAKKHPISIALVAQKDYEDRLRQLSIDHIILLREEKESLATEEKTLWKYQSCEKLMRELLEWIAEEGIMGRPIAGGKQMKLVGIYSPVGKCLKTSFSFVLGQLLGKKHKVLYLNLECYSGLGKLLKKEFTTDMSELLYYLQNTPERFAYRMGSMTERVGGLDILPPFGSFLDFVSVNKEEWIQFFREIERGSDYEYVILDLSDAIQGLLIGYFIVKAEPAIQILNRQVQSVSNGLISAKSMNRALSIGVAASIGLAVLRILTGTPIQWIIIPGYIIALIMSRMVPKIFVGIAFDSGGVASGPMTSTFLLPLCIGACEAIGANIMTDAFGVVALVALTPLIAIQIMGVNYQFKLNKQEKTAKPESLIPKDSDMIIEIEEE